MPVSVGEKDAGTISEILRAHTYICAQVRGTLEERRAGAESALSKIRPDPRYFKLHPFCEALIAVFDKYNAVTVRRHADGFRHYDDVTQDQSILLARTGHEEKLSAPISFDSLKHEALPLARSEDIGTIDIIRVPLLVGVRFVPNLLLREEAAFPESALGGPNISTEPDHPFMTWDREALDYGKEQFARAQVQSKISPFSTVATVKKAVLLHKELDECPPEYYAPQPFRLG